MIGSRFAEEIFCPSGRRAAAACALSAGRRSISAVTRLCFKSDLILKGNVAELRQRTLDDDFFSVLEPAWRSREAESQRPHGHHRLQVVVLHQHVARSSNKKLALAVELAADPF